MHPFSLSGKTALVVGASRGIGLAIARDLAAAGAHCIIAARSLDALEKEAAGLRGEGFSASTLRVDTADPDAFEPPPEVDILVNVSGTNIRKRFVDFTPDEYQRIMKTNLDGLFTITQRVGRGMIERKRGGKVIFIGSLMSLLGLPYISVYAVTKSALAGLTRVLAVEWAAYDIQVNCIAPGFIVTDLNRAMWQPAEMKQWLAGAQANTRLGTPEDVAPLAVFLASRGADYITGQVIAVDGGYSTTRRWPFEP
jgi:gluconate 5-dehydrogenase